MTPFYFWHLVMKTCFSIITMFARTILIVHACFQKDYRERDNAPYEQAMRNTHVCVFIYTGTLEIPGFLQFLDTCHTCSSLGCQKIEVSETELCVSVNEELGMFPSYRPISTFIHVSGTGERMLYLDFRFIKKKELLGSLRLSTKSLQQRPYAPRREAILITIR